MASKAYFIYGVSSPNPTLTTVVPMSLSSMDGSVTSSELYPSVMMTTAFSDFLHMTFVITSERTRSRVLPRIKGSILIKVTNELKKNVLLFRSIAYRNGYRHRCKLGRIQTLATFARHGIRPWMQMLKDA